jgi:hypothetical protein
MLVAEPWNSLEIAKLAVAALTPILLLALGYMVSRATRRSETLIESRLKLYEKWLLSSTICFAASPSSATLKKSNRPKRSR